MVEARNDFDTLRHSPRLLPGDPNKDWPPRPLIDIGPIDPDKLWVGATDLI